MNSYFLKEYCRTPFYMLYATASLEIIIITLLSHTSLFNSQKKHVFMNMNNKICKPITKRNVQMVRFDPGSPTTVAKCDFHIMHH